MQLVLLDEPHVPVETRAFIKPSVAEARVHAHHQVILFAIVRKVGDVEGEGRVTVIISADKTTIHEYQRAPERAIELQADPPPGIARREIEAAPVPAHAGLRIFPSE